MRSGRQETHDYLVYLSAFPIFLQDIFLVAIYHINFFNRYQKVDCKCAYWPGNEAQSFDIDLFGIFSFRQNIYTCKLINGKETIRISHKLFSKEGKWCIGVKRNQHIGSIKLIVGLFHVFFRLYRGSIHEIAPSRIFLQVRNAKYLKLSNFGLIP